MKRWLILSIFFCGLGAIHANAQEFTIFKKDTSPTLTSTAKPKPHKFNKKPPSNTSSATLKSLQATIDNQNQSLAAQNAQLSDLNKQLGAANQQILKLKEKERFFRWFNISNLLLLLWMLTVAALWQKAKKYKHLLMDYHELQDIREEEMQSVEEEETSRDSEESEENIEDSREEPLEIQPEHFELKEPTGKAVFLETPEEMPQSKLFASFYETAESETPGAEIKEGPPWEQGELDMPGMDYPHHLEDQNHSPTEEQDDLIDALSKGQDNVEWHRALLEFYIKTDSQHNFKRHYQDMLNTGLLFEGDAFWEEVRKMYLNKWIYQVDLPSGIMKG